MTSEAVPPVVVPAKWARLGTLGATEGEFAASELAVDALGDRLPDVTGLVEFDYTEDHTGVFGSAGFARHWGVRVRDVMTTIEGYPALGALRVDFQYLGPGTDNMRVVGALLVVTDGGAPNDYTIVSANYPLGDAPGPSPRPNVPLWDVIPDGWGPFGGAPYGNPFVEGFFIKADAEFPFATGRQHSVGGANISREDDGTYQVEEVANPPTSWSVTSLANYPASTWLVVGMNGSADDLDASRVYAAVTYGSYTIPGYTKSESMSAASGRGGIRRRKGIS